MNNNTTAAQPRPESTTTPHNSALEVEVLHFKPFNSKTLKGWFDIAIPSLGMKISGFGLHERDGERWLSLPSREYESGGERKFAPIVEFADKDSRDTFQRSALTALDAFRRGDL